jgi:putative (di)nucleoside polyphosphate hydrolase
MTREEIAALPYRRCAGVVLARPDGTVFAGKRIDNPGDAWQMPQGGIDPGEDARAAALRELHEETGVGPDLVTVEAETEGWIPYDLPVELVPRLWGGRFRGQEQRWVLMRFHGTDSDVDVAAEDRPHEAEFSEWRWMTPAELLERIVPFKRGVYEAVFTQLKP